jgi:DNA polymerase-1
MRIFGITNPDSVDKMKHRYPAKRVGFGILYGLTSMGLARELQADVGPEWTEDRCQDLIDTWFDVYKGVRRHMEAVYTHARRHGYVEDMWGRRTYTPEVHSAFPRTREEGLRKAGNCPIQGGAAGVFKIAMQKLWCETPYITEMYRKRLLFPLVPVHDDILWECHKDHTLEAARVIQSVMENAVTLSLPTPVDPERGERWGRMVKITDA